MIRFIKNFLDFFLPSFCSYCRNKLTPGEQFICAGCFSKINIADSERIKSEFERKFRDKKFISEFITHFVFEKDRELQSLIHSLKYEHKFLIGIFLGRIFAEANSAFFNSRSIDFITPVPLHHLKKSERGYNQADYIAKGISNRTGISLGKKLLKRTRFTQTQTALSLEEREVNMRNAFRVINASKIKGKNIFLVDDVITTGATTNECAGTLIKAGANKVYAGSIALAD